MTSLLSDVCLTGRRYKELNPGMYESTGSAVVPVIKKNHWQEPSYNETLTNEEINQLQVLSPVGSFFHLKTVFP